MILRLSYYEGILLEDDLSVICLAVCHEQNQLTLGSRTRVGDSYRNPFCISSEGSVRNSNRTSNHRVWSRA